MDKEVSKSQKIAYWILTGWLAFESVLSATWDFNWFNKGYAANIMDQIRFPHYFLIFKGIATLCSAPVFILPGLRVLKEWAYFGTFIMFAGAIGAHLVVGGAVNAIIAPFIFLCVTVGSWALRPPSRRLV